MSQGLLIFLIVLAVVVGVVEIVATHFVHKHYFDTYGIKIYGCGMLCAFILSGLIFSIVTLVSGSMVGVAILLVSLLGLAFVIYYDIKKLGVKKGLILVLIEFALCFGCLFEPVDLVAFKKKEYSEFRNSTNMLSKQQFEEYYEVDKKKKK